MQKYGIKITKGNDYRIVGVYQTVEEALENGDKVYNRLPGNSGTVSCILADFDENNNMVNSKYKLIKAWI